MSKKSSLIPDVAHELFRKHGFKRVSVEEICRKARVSKMTFYRQFPNKTELAKKVFDNGIDEATIRFERLLEEANNSEEFLRGLLLLKQDTTKGISKEFLADFYNHPEPAMKKYVEKRTREEWRRIIKELGKAQRKGLLRKDLNLDFFFQLLMRLHLLLSDESLLKSFKKPQDLITELSRMLAYGMTVQDSLKKR